MSIQIHASALLTRHLQRVKKRRQSMLIRAIAEMEFDIALEQYCYYTPGASQTPPSFGQAYDRSPASIS